MRILSGDPGKVNFALSVIDMADRRLDILGTRMLGSPVRTLKVDTREQVSLFLAELDELWETYGPFDGCCFERFQTRGLCGDTIESISLMLGVLSMWCLEKEVPIRLITASQWKNQLNRVVNLKELYKEHKLTSKKSLKAIHEFDALLIGLYMVGLLEDANTFANIDKVIDPLVHKFLHSPEL